MSCTGYRPPFGVGQLDGTKFAGSNCTCWSAGKACDDDTCGSQHPSSSQVRFWTGDTSGGTNLAEVAEALHDHTATILDVRYRYPWSEFLRRLAAGQSAILQGWYAPIRASRFSGSETFGGNHAILVTRGLVALDPLADGRRSGIYKYHGEGYPETLLRSFAGKLNLSGDPSLYRPLGDGLCYAAFTRDNDTTWLATCRPSPDQPTTTFDRYFVANGRITGHEKRRTKGFHLPCDTPRMILRQTINERVSLVRLTKPGSAMDGWWVSSKYAREYP